MNDGYPDRDTAANLLERRWFSAFTAVQTAQAECEVLREVMEHAEAAWRRARAQLAKYEALRDAFDEELAARDGYLRDAADTPELRSARSAA